MPRPTLQQIRGIGNFQEITRWNFAMLVPPTAVPVNSNALNLRCETSELPKRTVQTIDVNLRGHRVKQSGISDYSGVLTVTFMEDVNSTIKDFLRRWREAISETNTGVSLPKSELEAVIGLTQLDQSDNGVWQYQIKGCLLEDYDLGQLDGATSDVQRPSMTVSFDLFSDGPL